MKKMGGHTGIILLALLLILAPMSMAKADSSQGPYVGIFGGLVLPSDLSASDNTDSLDFDLDNSFMLGVKGGYIFPAFPYLAAEIEYNYMGEQDASFMSVNVGKVSLNNLFANLIFRYPQGMFHPYIGAGIGWSWIKWDSTGVGASAGLTDEDDNAWAWQFLVGINVSFDRNWSADLGYRYFSAENFKYRDVDIEYKASIITFGVNYHF